MSYSHAACSVDWNKPIHIFLWVCWSVILATHVPQFRCCMSMYCLCGGGGDGRTSGKPGRPAREEEALAPLEEELQARPWARDHS